MVEAWLKERPWVSHFVPHRVVVQDRLKRLRNPPAPATDLDSGSPLALGGSRNLQSLSAMEGRCRKPSPLQPAQRNQPPASSADRYMGGRWACGGPSSIKRLLVWTMDVGEGASTAEASLSRSMLTGTSRLQPRLGPSQTQSLLRTRGSQLSLTLRRQRSSLWRRLKSLLRAGVSRLTSLVLRRQWSSQRHRLQSLLHAGGSNLTSHVFPRQRSPRHLLRSLPRTRGFRLASLLFRRRRSSLHLLRALLEPEAPG